MISQIGFDNANILFSSEIRRQVLDYLQQCSNLVSSVKSYQILGNVNFSMAKESRYFNDIGTRMFVAGERIRGTHRSSDLAQKQNSASMYFFIIVSIIVSASLLVLTLFENVPALRTTTYVVAGFFLLVAIVIYVLEYSSYVRTDGDKKYWSQPAHTDMMDTP